MRSFLLRLVFGVILLIISTPRTMATEVISEGSRADFFCALNLGEREKKASFDFNDAAALPAGEFAQRSDSGGQNAKEGKRRQNRPYSLQNLCVNCCFSVSFLAELAPEGFFKRPEVRDARQELTAVIRFLQMAALAC